MAKDTNSGRNNSSKQSTDYSKGVMGSKGQTLAPVKPPSKSPIGPGSGYLGYKPPTTIKKPSGKGKGKKTPAEADPIIQYVYVGGDIGESIGESAPSVVMIPERDVVNLATEDIDAATITNLLFENIGANELVKFVRNDTVEGLNPYYNIISNLSDIRRRFNPSDLISEQITDIDSEGYSINIDNKIPDQDYLDDQGITDYVYIDEATGDLVIHVVNMKESETVEVQIDTNGTIYEVNN